MKQARFTALARAELLAEASYYENRRTGLGVLPTFPFGLVYTETDYGILIHAVAHNRRGSTYWIGRLRGEV